MVDIANKTVAFLIVAIIIVVIGSVISLEMIDKLQVTGADVSQGTVSINIPSYIGITLLNNVSFGDGAINSSCDYASLYSNTSERDSCWINYTPYNPSNFRIRNEATIPLSLYVASDKNASDFIGGNESLNEFKYSYQNCTAGCTATSSGWNEFNISSNDYFLANWSGNSFFEELEAGIAVTIPSDALGEKETNVTFTVIAV